MASSAFNQAQSAQFQQQQQQALLQSLAGQQQQTGRSRSRRGRQDGLPVGSRAPPANAGQSRFGRTGGAVQFGQGNDAALMQLATQQARAPLPSITERVVGAHGIRRGGAATGTPISATGDQAIEEFLETHADCQGLTRESLVDFLNTVAQLGYNLEDIQSAMRTLYDSGALGAALPDLQRRSRWAGGVFAAEVRGTRGARGEVPMPSTLWQIASTYCDALDTVTDGLLQIANGTFGTEATGPLPAANTLVDQATLDQINAELAGFVASHSQCAADEDELREFLALVDATRTNATQLFALVRAFGLEGYLSQLMSRSNVRWAGGAFTPATTGVTPETFNRLKRSMLWAVAERYCRQMGPLNEFVYNIITGRAAEGLAGPQAGAVIGTAAGFKPGGSANVSRAGSGTFGTRGAGANARPMSL
ncbi:hypothetical protein [Pandoravirus japonicus]|uniref:Uncharacterized protein n=1 Tax=Pandoravirus japonicus TaxID=2823154 RepID=A0A811BNY4_9VIRU|nr:hypothetical protein [Pandoravirus japonicus]